jgi:RNA polymerase sigma factor (sigma-70 family)
MEFQYQLIKLQEILMKYAYSLTANIDDAKDLVQETNLKALTNRDKFEDESNIQAWAFTILKNTFINSYRKTIKHNTLLCANDNLCLINSKSENNGPESQYMHSEINLKIEALHDNLRIPFKMLTAGYKYKEIADNLKIKIGTVKSRIYLTRKQLMNQL